jgi:hypothetical protein
MVKRVIVDLARPGAIAQSGRIAIGRIAIGRIAIGQIVARASHEATSDPGRRLRRRVP